MPWDFFSFKRTQKSTISWLAAGSFLGREFVFSQQKCWMWFFSPISFPGILRWILHLLLSTCYHVTKVVQCPYRAKQMWKNAEQTNGWNDDFPSVLVQTPTSYLKALNSSRLCLGSKQTPPQKTTFVIFKLWQIINTKGTTVVCV